MDIEEKKMREEFFYKNILHDLDELIKMKELL